jgi:hypothetical protein
MSFGPGRSFALTAIDLAKSGPPEKDLRQALSGLFRPWNDPTQKGNGYRDLIKTIAARAPSPRITLISPTPTMRFTHGTEFPHYNEVVSRYEAFVKELAAYPLPV